MPKGSLCLFDEIFVGTTSWFIDDKILIVNDNLVKFLNNKFTKNKISLLKNQFIYQRKH